MSPTVLRTRLARLRQNPRDDSGFTLLELLTVIIILGILFAIGAGAFSSIRQKQLAQKALEENGGAPTPEPIPEPVTTSAPADPIQWGTIFGILGAVLLGIIVLTAAVVAFNSVLAARKTRKNMAATEAAARASVVTSWVQAVAKHMVIKDDYAALLTDPVAALSYSALWDVANTRTRAFHEVYSRAQDIYSVYGDTAPEDASLVDQYATTVRDAELVWKDARAHAEKLGYGWMPPADKTAARRATAMLKTAVNPAASEAERGTAAVRAKELIDSIGAVRFRTETMVALNDAVRLALPAGNGDEVAVVLAKA